MATATVADIFTVEMQDVQPPDHEPPVQRRPTGRRRHRNPIVELLNGAKCQLELLANLKLLPEHLENDQDWLEWSAGSRVNTRGHLNTFSDSVEEGASNSLGADEDSPMQGAASWSRRTSSMPRRSSEDTTTTGCSSESRKPARAERTRKTGYPSAEPARDVPREEVTRIDHEDCIPVWWKNMVKENEQKKKDAAARLATSKGGPEIPARPISPRPTTRAARPATTLSAPRAPSIGSPSMRPSNLARRLAVSGPPLAFVG
jgi:hypothetical protein